jgi:hypothetical protein
MPSSARLRRSRHWLVFSMPMANPADLISADLFRPVITFDS